MRIHLAKVVGKRGPPPPLGEIVVGLKAPGDCEIGELCGGGGPFIPRAKENYFTITFAEWLYFQREPIIQVKYLHIRSSGEP